ncbi:hypothetical protein D3C87_90290 [compost metagenome]
MKTVKNSLFAFVMLSTLAAFAAGNGDTGSAQSQRDGTPSKRVALRLASNYAMDEAFVNILDGASSVAVRLSGDNGAQFIFRATATTPGLADCTVEILVSQETGMAFQDKIEACQNLN